MILTLNQESGHPPVVNQAMRNPAGESILSHPNSAIRCDHPLENSHSEIQLYLRLPLPP
jgi:hypothetical protein